MRIRRSRRAMLCRLLLVMLVAWWAVPDDILTRLLGTGRFVNVRRSRVSTTYVLRDDHWTTFDIPNDRTSVLVTTYACEEPSRPHDVTQNVSYAVEYEIVDDEQRRLRRSTYHFRTRQEWLTDPTTKEQLSARYFVGHESRPLSSRAITLKLDGLAAGPKRLRLRAAPGREDVRDVVVKVYVRDRPPHYKLRFLWQRMSNESRRHLARAHVHSMALARPHEKNALIRNRWTPLAPLGIEGRGYHLRKLYSLRRDEFETEVRTTVFPDGLVVSPGLVGVVPIPRDGGDVRFRIDRVGESANADPETASVHFLWRSGWSKRDSSTVLVGAEGTVVDKQFRGGILEIEASATVAVRAWLLSDPVVPEITPEPVFVPAYLTGRGETLDLAVIPVWNHGTTYRVDLRRWVEDSVAFEGTATAAVMYQFLDAEEAVLTEGAILHRGTLSRYETLSGARTGERVTEVSSRFVSAPAGAQTLRIRSASDGVLVSVYTRAHGLPRRQRIPEDSNAFERQHAVDGEGALARSWHVVRALDGGRLVRERRELFVQRQSGVNRWASDRPELKWEDRSELPVSETTTLPILTKTVIGFPDGPSATRFQRLTLGVPHLIRIAGDPGDAFVRPKLTWIKPDGESAFVRVLLDGSVLREGVLRGRFVDWVLPPVASGHHEIRVTSPRALQCFGSRMAGSHETAWVKRLIHRVDGEPAKFRLVKHTAGAERVKILMYVPVESTERLVLGAHLDLPASRGLADRGGWTFSRHELDINTVEGTPVTVLEPDVSPLKSLPYAVITLDEDFEPGDYELELTHRSGPDCYVHMIRQVPESDERRESKVRKILEGESDDRAPLEEDA